MVEREAPLDDFDLSIGLADIEIDRSSAIAPQLYAVLRQRIIENRLPPCAPVNESDVARLCDVSRTPLRAAMQQLATEGLIRTRPQVGTIVAPLNEKRLREAAVIRSALEQAVVRQLAGRVLEDAVLAPVLAAQHRAAEADDYAMFFIHDEAFHQMLAEQAELPMAWQLSQSVKAHIDRQRLVLMSAIRGRSMSAFHDHLTILELIRAGDADGAACAMEKHVLSVLEGTEKCADGDLDDQSAL